MTYLDTTACPHVRGDNSGNKGLVQIWPGESTVSFPRSQGTSSSDPDEPGNEFTREWVASPFRSQRASSRVRCFCFSSQHQRVSKGDNHHSPQTAPVKTTKLTGVVHLEFSTCCSLREVPGAVGFCRRGMMRRFPAIPGGKAMAGGLLSLKPARRIHRGRPR